MNRYLLLGLMYCTLSCASASKVQPDVRMERLEKEVRNLDFRTLYLEYELHIQKCFWKYDVCVVRRDLDCWKKHERCVIEITKGYRQRLKIRGFPTN